MQTKLTFLFFFFFSFNAIAQHIPDANFAAAIRQQCPSCINGNDSLTSAAANVIYLNLNSINIDSLTGIEGFSSLTYLECVHNKIKYLPVLPNTLIWLRCDQNLITNLGTLPNSLVVLQCDDNKLTSLPSILPNNLEELWCQSNQLTSLPTLPNSLKTLYYSGNRITNLSVLPNSLINLGCGSNEIINLPSLPNTLDYLACSDNKIINLPLLPNNLTRLNCRGNKITTFPPLPDTLKILECPNNEIVNLPTLPNGLITLDCGGNKIVNLSTLPSSLKQLYCSYNYQLVSLPTLPNGLTHLDCQVGNQLVSLPTLPESLIFLNCSSSNSLRSLPNLPPTLLYLLASYSLNLQCIGILPSTLTHLNLYGTGLSCLPNIPSGVASQTNLPICNQTNNTNNCFIPPIVSGTVYYDQNNNSTQDAGEQGIPNTMVRDNGIANGRFVAMTDSLGRYVGAADTSATTFIGVDSVSAVFTTNPWLRSFNTNDEPYQKITNQNFGYRALRLDDSIQTYIHTSTLVPGDSSICTVIYRNRGSSILNGTVTVNLSDTLLFLSANTQRLANHSGNRLTTNTHIFPYSNLQLFQQKAINIKVKTPPDPTLIGRQIHNKVTARGNGGGGGTEDTDTEVPTILGSHDPNSKECEAVALTPAEVQEGKPIVYTINFENTGTWHAKWIVIEDTLSEHLDYRTLRTLITSHPRYQVTMAFDTTNLAHKVIVKWMFPNIGLKYKTLSPLEAQGFVKFSIQAKPTAPAGAAIENTAYIYFDVNPAVVTNTVGLNIMHPLPVTWLSVEASAQTDKKNLVQWETASEQNNKYFIVERSSDGFAFQHLSTVQATTNQSGAKYTYIDAAIAPHQTYYYRICQVDIDGTKSYSAIVSVTASSAINHYTVSPNPATTTTTISWQTELSEDALLAVVNALGEKVMEKVLEKNTKIYTLPLDNLASGVYFIRISTGNKAEQTRLVKQ